LGCTFPFSFTFTFAFTFATMSKSIKVTLDSKQLVHYSSNNYSLVVVKGMVDHNTSAEPIYNTAWQVVPPESLSMIRTFTWTPEYQIRFGQKYEVNQVIQEGTTNQLQVQLGDKSKLDEHNQIVRDGRLESNIALAVEQASKSREGWTLQVGNAVANPESFSPFFVTQKEMFSGETFMGTPVQQYTIYFGKDVKEKMMLGIITGEKAVVDLTKQTSVKLTLHPDGSGFTWNVPEYENN
jgi:hypothetical protein